jgi:hypothetical protein
LPDIDAELEQFAMNPRSTPKPKQRNPARQRMKRGMMVTTTTVRSN